MHSRGEYVGGNDQAFVFGNMQDGGVVAGAEFDFRPWEGQFRHIEIPADDVALGKAHFQPAAALSPRSRGASLSSTALTYL